MHRWGATVLADELDPVHLGRFEAERSTRPARVPTVLSAAEVARLFAAMEPGSMRRLMAQVLYGTGLRLMECCRLRVRDLDFDRGQIVVRGGKGDKDRIVMIPACCRGALAEQVRRVRHRHERDVARGGGYVSVPDSVGIKCPDAGARTSFSSLLSRSRIIECLAPAPARDASPARPIVTAPIHSGALHHGAASVLP